MPSIITSDYGQNDSVKVNADYTYTNGIDLKPSSKVSKDLVSHLLTLARESLGAMSNRHNEWKSIDDTLTCYIPLDEAEKAVKNKDDRKPVSIVFPQSYALLETTVAYLCDAFLQAPIFRYSGTTANDKAGAMLLELLIQQHVVRNKIGLTLHTAFRDATAYGMCGCIPTWKEVKGLKQTVSETGYFFKRKTFNLTEATLFEGNDLINVDPYRLLIDPNVSIGDVQKGEFVGWLDSELLLDLMEREDRGELFNVKYLEAATTRTSALISAKSILRSRLSKNGLGGSNTPSTNARSQRCDILSMHVKIVPKKFGLSNSNKVEKWFFRIAADSIILEARQSGLNHNMFPVAIGAPEFDGYSCSPLSRIELTSGLQKVLDWMFNTHITNVRKSIHDMFVVDPYLVNLKDITNPEGGRLIRLRQPAWGKGVTNAIAQLPVQDVTQNHVRDASLLVNWMSKISGVDDAMMGMMRQGGPERLTSSEYEGTKNGALSRLGRVTKLLGMQLMQDIAYFFASHTQQFMSKETYVNFYGDNEAILRSMYEGDGRFISPFDISIDHDIVPHDGTIRGSNYNPVWMDLFKTIAGDQELRASFDVPKIFKYIAKSVGADSVDSFVRVQPDQKVQQEAQAGNMVPMNEVDSQLLTAMMG